MFNSYRPYQSLYTQEFYVGLKLRVNGTQGLINTVSGPRYKNLNHSYLYFSVLKFSYVDKSDITLQLTEADVKSTQLDIFSTLPILCGKGYASCSIPISMYKETTYDVTCNKKWCSFLFLISF